MEEAFLKKEVRKVFSAIGFSYAAFVGATMLLQVLLVWGMEAGVVTLIGYHADMAIFLSMSTMYIVGFPVFWLLFRRIPVLEEIPKQRWGLGTLAICFIICISVVYIGNFIGQGLMFMVSSFTGEPMVNIVEEVLRDVSPLVIFLSSVIIAPLVEELMFRKMLIDRIARYGQGVAVVVSGVLFGLVHGNFYQFFYAFGLGMIFAYIYVKTGKVLYTIIFHMLINFLGSMVPLSLLQFMERSAIVGGLVLAFYGLLIMGFIVAGIVLLICFWKKIKFDTGSVIIPRESRVTVVFFNLGMAVYLVLCAVLFFMS